MTSPNRPRFEQLNNLASAIQSITAAVAIIIGGIWIVLKFNVLLEPQIARAKLAITEREAEKNAIINVNVTATLPSNPNGKQKLIHAKVTVKNNGVDSVLFNFKDNPPLRIGYRTEKGFELVGKSPVLMVGNQAAAGDFLLRADAVANFEFLVPIKDSGAYLVEFSTPALLEGEKLQYNYYGHTILLVQ